MIALETDRAEIIARYAAGAGPSQIEYETGIGANRINTVLRTYPGRRSLVEAAVNYWVKPPARPEAGGSFGLWLRYYRERAQLTANHLGERAGVNTSYISRVELGQREPPKLGILEALVRQLSLSAEEIDSLYLAAGYAPPSLAALGEWPEWLTPLLAGWREHRVRR